MSTAVLLVSHGTVDDLEHLAEFVTRVRRGRPGPPELVAELRRRYEVIGGVSPLNATSAALAHKLEHRLGLPVAWANRLWSPSVGERLAELMRSGVRTVALVPLAQHSAHVYAADARAAAEQQGMRLLCAPNWGGSEALCEAFASRVTEVLGTVPPGDRTALLMTAHSLPRAVVDAGDPYEREVRAAAAAVALSVRARVSHDLHATVAFQSQGAADRPAEWLGPDVSTAIESAANAGCRHLVVSPIGFLADHLETLYDLDVEARAMATARGLTFVRAASLNAADDLVQVLADVARRLVHHG